MIATFAATFGLASLQFVRSPGAQLVSIEIAIRFRPDEFGSDDIRESIGRRLSSQTADYGPSAILRILSGSGRNFDVTAAPDAIRLGFSVPRIDWRLGLSLAASILRSPRPEGSNTAEALPKPFWTSSAFSWPKVGLLADRDAAKVAAWILVPNRCYVGIAGDLEPTEVEAEWIRRVADWSPPSSLRAPQIRSSQGAVRRESAIEGVSVTGLSTDVPSEDFPAALLAAACLGVGKDSTAYRILRKELGISYRQEAFVVPTTYGWRIRLQWAEAAQSDAESVKSRLRADIESWSVGTAKRATEMLRSIFILGLRWPVLWLDPWTPVDGGDSSLAYLAAYWLLRTGEPFDADQMVKSIGSIPIERVKALALKLCA